MDPLEVLKLLGNGGAQIILVAGYYPAYRLIKRLWLDRDGLSDKLLATLNQQFADADKRKELWDANGKVIDGLAAASRDQAAAIKDLTREVRDGLQRTRP